MTKKTSTLKEEVQKIRDEERKRLRMEKINSLLIKNSIHNKALATFKKQIKTNKKAEKIELYTLKKNLDLNKEHPNYKRIEEKTKKKIEETKKFFKLQDEKNKNLIKLTEEKIKENNEKIKDIEKGEIKISLDRLNENTTQKILHIKM